MKRVLSSLFVLIAVMLASGNLFAHCDTLDGPVVSTARVALEKGDITPVLKWVRPDDEKVIKEVFARVLVARKASFEAKEIADRYFYETLVRIHRAGEGVPYTGLQSAPAEPIFTAADKALETGSVDNVIKHVSTAVSEGIKKRFNETLERKKHADQNVAAGREFVESYVEFTHYVERLNNDAVGKTNTHGADAGNAATGGHQH